MTGPLVATPAGNASVPGARWSPNQEAMRSRVAQAAARLVARSGIAGCTIRAVADEAGLTKSTVHYYVDNAGELVDLAVLTFLQQFAEQVRARMDAAPDGREALGVLVRTFLPPAAVAAAPDDPARLNSLNLWTSYLAHAWPRGVDAEVLACFETIRALFETALDRCGVPDAEERARAVHLYLLGAVQHNIMRPLPGPEVARAVEALSGVALDLT
ncbi:TetR family transcriptional regulator [Frankia sp. AgB1.9]|uniref:TetR/AcrR family transcriptional regulator n=1 Tax=unclassified Frankia TaxID=2632575 RepID=UPI00193192F8|nr:MULTISPECIES: TetR family transcriptional regulator [unclassified Frankia]MBL7493128.1 TetR family transcriptional regulator [Frankia sp. AgW1.1]MBL7551495.1 TetR family transcriptional regulator [Frankia sp. AgB1.9]MBL7623608.1 TetR family transcriptional regulator [Frankia sp. AgB1.8]